MDGLIGQAVSTYLYLRLIGWWQQLVPPVASPLV